MRRFSREPWYGRRNRLIRDGHAGADANRTVLRTRRRAARTRHVLAAGYDQLKAYLMMARPDKSRRCLYAQVMTTTAPSRPDSPRRCGRVSPRPSRLYAEPAVAPPGKSRRTGSWSPVRQVLLEQIGRRNAESTLYENMLTRVRRSYADMTLEDMTPQTDAGRLFSTPESVPGMITRQAGGGFRKPLITPWRRGAMKSTGC